MVQNVGHSIDCLVPITIRKTKLKLSAKKKDKLFHYTDRLESQFLGVNKSTTLPFNNQGNNDLDRSRNVSRHIENNHTNVVNTQMNSL